MKTSAVIVAAGASTRMGSGMSKQLIPLCGRTLIGHTLAAFDRCPYVSEIILVARKCDLPAISTVAKEAVADKPLKIMAGGDTREQSVLNGINACDPAAELLCIHDGARALVTAEMLERVMLAAGEAGAAALAVPVKDTVKRCAADGFILDTPRRSELWLAQTPQVFRRELYLRALESHARHPVPVTDDCRLLELAGIPVKLVMGGYDNIKVTTPEDVLIAQALLEARSQRQDARA